MLFGASPALGAAAGAGAGVAAGFGASPAAGVIAAAGGVTVTEPAGVAVVVVAAGAGIAAAAGAAGATASVLAGAAKSLLPPLLCFLEIRDASTTVTMNSAAASQLVPFCRALVAWAPHIWLATPSPKAAPSPSCRGRCIRMMRTRSRHTSTSTTVSKLIRMSIKGRGLCRLRLSWQAEGAAKKRPRGADGLRNFLNQSWMGPRQPVPVAAACILPRSRPRPCQTSRFREQ